MVEKVLEFCIKLNRLDSCLEIPVLKFHFRIWIKCFLLRKEADISETEVKLERGVRLQSHIVRNQLCQEYPNAFFFDTNTSKKGCETP